MRHPKLHKRDRKRLLELQQQHPLVVIDNERPVVGEQMSAAVDEFNLRCSGSIVTSDCVAQSVRQ